VHDLAILMVVVVINVTISIFHDNARLISIWGTPIFFSTVFYGDNGFDKLLQD